MAGVVAQGSSPKDEQVTTRSPVQRIGASQAQLQIRLGTGEGEGEGELAWGHCSWPQGHRQRLTRSQSPRSGGHPHQKISRHSFRHTPSLQPQPGLGPIQRLASPKVPDPGSKHRGGTNVPVFRGESDLVPTKGTRARLPARASPGDQRQDPGGAGGNEWKGVGQPRPDSRPGTWWCCPPCVVACPGRPMCRAHPHAHIGTEGLLWTGSEACRCGAAGGGAMGGRWRGGLAGCAGLGPRRCRAPGPPQPRSDSPRLRPVRRRGCSRCCAVVGPVSRRVGGGVSGDGRGAMARGTWLGPSRPAHSTPPLGPSCARTAHSRSCPRRRGPCPTVTAPCATSGMAVPPRPPSCQAMGEWAVCWPGGRRGHSPRPTHSSAAGQDSTRPAQTPTPPSPPPSQRVHGARRGARCPGHGRGGRRQVRHGQRAHAAKGLAWENGRVAWRV